MGEPTVVTIEIDAEDGVLLETEFRVEPTPEPPPTPPEQPST